MVDAHFIALAFCFVTLRVGLLGLFLGLSGVGVGLGFGGRRSDRLPGAGRGPEDQAGRNRDRSRQRRPVLAGEFVEFVHGGWGPCEDGFVVKITLDVGGERTG